MLKHQFNSFEFLELIKSPKLFRKKLNNTFFNPLKFVNIYSDKSCRNFLKTVHVNYSWYFSGITLTHLVYLTSTYLVTQLTLTV